MKVKCGKCGAKFDEGDKESMVDHFLEQHQVEVYKALESDIEDWFEECD